MTMDLEKLARISGDNREAATNNTLLQLPGDFYADTSAYIRMLNQYHEESSGRERDMLADELKNAQIIIDGISCNRQRVIVNMAVVDANSGRCRDTDTLLPVEAELYRDVLIAVDHYYTETCRKIIAGKAPGESGVKAGIVSQ